MDGTGYHELDSWQVDSSKTHKHAGASDRRKVESICACASLLNRQACSPYFRFS